MGPAGIRSDTLGSCRSVHGYRLTSVWPRNRCIGRRPAWRLSGPARGRLVPARCARAAAGRGAAGLLLGAEEADCPGTEGESERARMSVLAAGGDGHANWRGAAGDQVRVSLEGDLRYV